MIQLNTSRVGTHARSVLSATHVFSRQTRLRCGKTMLCVLLGIVCLLGSAMNSASAQSPTADAAVESPVRDSAWYDEQTGQILPVEVEDQRSDTENRDSRWTGVSTTGGKAAKAPAATTGGFSWGRLFGWLMLIALLTGLVSVLVWVFANSDFDFNSGTIEQSLITGQQLDQQTRQRMEHLPEALRDTTVNPRGQAEKLMQEGQYNEAIIYLFGHQLLLLDRVHWLRLARGKTNSRYVRETRRSEPMTGQRLQETVASFERAYFGRHEISQSEFERLWQQNEAMEQDIQHASSPKKTGAA